MLLEVQLPSTPAVEAEVGAKIRTRHPAWPGWIPGHWYAREYTWLLEQAGDVTGLRCLDAGGALSPISAILSDRGASEVVVVDLRPPRPYPARGRIVPMTADLQATGLEPGSFDLIVSPSSVRLNEWPAQERIIHHLLDLLRPGGRLLLTVPAALATADERFIADLAGRGCVYLWTHASARRMRDAVKALAILETPLLRAPQYDREVQRIEAEMRALSPQLPGFPYQSMALAWRRR